MVMSFGKYRGREVRTVPISYLRWVSGNVDVSNPWLKAEIEARIAEVDRVSRPTWTPPPARTVRVDALESAVKGWYRDLSVKHHPDRGGNTERMIAINDAHEALRRVLGQLGGEGQ